MKKNLWLILVFALTPVLTHSAEPLSFEAKVLGSDRIILGTYEGVTLGSEEEPLTLAQTGYGMTVHLVKVASYFKPEMDCPDNETIEIATLGGWGYKKKNGKMTGEANWTDPPHDTFQMIRGEQVLFLKKLPGTDRYMVHGEQEGYRQVFNANGPSVELTIQDTRLLGQAARTRFEEEHATLERTKQAGEVVPTGKVPQLHREVVSISEFQDRVNQALSRARPEGR